MSQTDKVRLLADDRLGALRGQSLTVGSALVFVPESGPIEVEPSVAEILVAQPGWRYAPAVVRPAPVAEVGPEVSMPRPQPWAQAKPSRRHQRPGRGKIP